MRVLHEAVSTASPLRRSTSQRITKLLNSTLARFDKEALVKWDALARDQQARLEAVSAFVRSE